jgi:hypothetical protein
MEGYLGETVLDIHKTKYAMYTPQDWVMFWIERYGGIDGSHHKDWLIDQIARILKGTKVIINLAKWDNGFEEERFTLEDNATPEYHKWVEEICDGEDGPNTYSHDIGIAP